MSGKTYLIASSFFMIMYLLVSCSQQSPFVQDMETYSFDDLGTWTIYIPASWPERYKRENEFPIISSIAIDSGGAVWFATTGGPVAIGDGVYRFDGKNWVHFSTENGLPSEEISSMVAGPNGIIWFGTHCCGIAKFDGKTWDHFTVANGLGSNDVRSIAVAPDGKLWVGTSENGLSIYDGIGWKTIQDEAGIPRGFVGDIFILPIWKYFV
jgi:ligand-binding sensor domain-containing protein